MAESNAPVAAADGYVLAPVILRPLAVSEIKDAMEVEFNFHIDQARPLWARLLEIAAGIPLDEQERIHDNARRRAPAPLNGWQARAKLVDALNGWRVYEAGGYQLLAYHPDVGEVRGDSRDRGGVYSVIALLKTVLDAMSANSQPACDVHPDDLAVDRFSAAMKAKLAVARAKGRGGWDGPDCSADTLSRMLREHVEKGDPRDVANLCMFLHQRGEAIQPAPEVDRG